MKHLLSLILLLLALSFLDERPHNMQIFSDDPFREHQPDAYGVHQP